MKRALNPATVPASPYYAQGIEVTGSTRTVFVSGQVGVDAQGATVEGIAGQAQQAVANLNAVLAEAGLEPDSIVKLTIYLTDPANVGPVHRGRGADPAARPAGHHDAPRRRAGRPRPPGRGRGRGDGLREVVTLGVCASPSSPTPTPRASGSGARLPLRQRSTAWT